VVETEGGRGKLPATAPACEKEIEKALNEVATLFDGTNVYPFLVEVSLDAKMVGVIFDELTDRFDSGGDRLLVMVHSGGGNVDAAYNMAELFRSYGKKELLFVVPRWAKSAATVLVCGGDKILMAPPAELGPVDPQITEMNLLENRLEQFSPLHIESTLELIRDEFKNGNDKLAEGLIQRLQFPLTLGSFKKSLELGQVYLERLLSSRMLKDQSEAASKAAKRLTEGYPDHSFCINLAEAQDLGLKAEALEGQALKAVWRIHRLDQQRREITKKKKQREMEKQIKDLPPEILQGLPELGDALDQHGSREVDQREPRSL